jgi:segregation and condensation protein B
LTKTEETAGMNVPPAGQNHKMTLRRFVSVTFDNFRQLIQTMATPTTSLPVPASITPKANGVATPISQSHPAEPTSMETDTLGSDTLETGSVGADMAQGLAAVMVAAPAVAHAGVLEGEPAAVQHDSTELVPAEEAPPAAADAAVVNVPLVAALESLLFVADEAVEPAQLARALGIGAAEVEAGLQALDAVYREGERGLRLQTRNGRYQLVTAPEAANLIETFLNLDTTTKLSGPALETLAVAAYRQPVTRAQIEAVRGVDCSGVLRSLLQRGLLEEVGRLDAPGRPVLYGVTDLFMHHFGLTALHELPPLESTELARIEEATDQQA